MGARLRGIASALVCAAVLSAGSDIAAIAHAGPAIQFPDVVVEPGTGRAAIRHDIRPVSDGLDVSQEAIDAYSALKAQKFRFVVLKIDDSFHHVVVEKTSESTNHEDFVEAMQAGGESVGRYGLYDFRYERDGKQLRKIFLIMWIPGTAKSKQRHAYSSGFESVKRKMSDVMPYRADSVGELSDDAFDEEARKTP
ncbi:hypothetical protein AB0M22_37670 [Nocardia sp. NPDC051756]|uniref:hypothetical protein n=1 Tax=Nocardia sp. NPDC051756 TaxID=3154751 RepID=UPI00341373DD